MRVTRKVLDAIERHAARDAPHECCGLLIGTGMAVIEAVPCANVAADPARRYTIAPEDFFAQIHRCRSSPRPVRVVGAYHSHPASEAIPSATDLGEAFSGFLYLIAGPVGGPGGLTIRGYQLVSGNLQPVRLVPEPEESDP